jgi:transketolase
MLTYGSHSSPEAIVLDARSRALRQTIVKTLAAGRRGHVGAAFSAIEMLRVLYDDVLKFDSARPHWPERDRFILSKGHGCLALYVLLADKGFFPKSELWRFCSAEGFLGGHPEYGKVPGVEASTGSLGHGLSFGVGFALAARMDSRPSRVFVVLGDGECGEGSVWEAALSAAQHQLSNLTILIDYNKQQTYGNLSEVQGLEPLVDKLTAFGFGVREVNGHDTEQLRDCLKAVPFMERQPSAIVCHTVKGKGVPFTEKNLSWHHKSRVTEAETEALLAALED